MQFYNVDALCPLQSNVVSNLHIITINLKRHLILDGYKKHQCCFFFFQVMKGSLCTEAVVHILRLLNGYL